MSCLFPAYGSKQEATNEDKNNVPCSSNQALVLSDKGETNQKLQQAVLLPSSESYDLSLIQRQHRDRNLIDVSSDDSVQSCSSDSNSVIFVGERRKRDKKKKSKKKEKKSKKHSKHKDQEDRSSHKKRKHKSMFFIFWSNLFVEIS